MFGVTKSDSVFVDSSVFSLVVSLLKNRRKPPKGNRLTRIRIIFVRAPREAISSFIGLGEECRDADPLAVAK